MSHVYEHSPGNHGDVLKHLVFINMVRKMQEQHPEGIVLVDTHSGPGMYDLTQLKPPEWKKAILPVVQRKNDAPKPVADYVKFSVGWSTTEKTLEYYPGSPAIGQKLLRPQDEHRMTDLYVSDMQGLDERHSSFQQLDAFDEATLDYYLADRAGSGEPGTKHLVVLIDPSYDTDAEYGQGKALLERLLDARPRACVMLWVPFVTGTRYKWAIPKALKEMATKKCKIGQYNAMLTVGTTTKLEGSYIFVANPVKEFDDVVSDDTLDYVSKLTVQGKGEFAVEQRMKKPKAKPVEEE